MVAKSIRQGVLSALAQIRPYLQGDGGDIELVGISEDMEVTVRLLGSCDRCPFSAMTMQHGVEETILKHVPEIKRVVALGVTD